MRLTTAAVISVALIATSSVHVSAHQKIKTDPNEGSRLDAGSAVFEHDARNLYMTVSTYQPWRDRLMSKEGYWMAIELDTERDGRFDFLLGIAFKKGRLKGQVYKFLGRQERRWRGHATVRRISPTTIRFRVSRSLVRARSSYVRWKLFTYTPALLDIVPDRGYKTHLMR